MAEQRKISVRKVLQFIVTIIVVTGCVVAVTSASRRQEEQTVKAVDIRIRNGQQSRFLDQEEVRQMLLTRRHIDVTKLPLSKVDVHQMEAIAKSNPWVGAAEAFVDNARVLHITVTQRVPVVRLFDREGSSYYLDTALQQLPLSLNYTQYVPVVTGVPVLKDDSVSNSIRGQIKAISSFIARDTFWNAQVQEISMNAGGEFELVPVLGKQRILIGDTSRLADKFSNLFTFYKKVLNRIGWDKYEVLDVRFAGQVVASPALPWKAPVDRALSTMSWVKSIVGPDDGKDDDRPAPIPGAAAAPAVPAAAAPVAATVPARASIVAKNNNPLPVRPAPKPPAQAAVKKAVVPQARPQEKKKPEHTPPEHQASASKKETKPPAQKQEQPRKPKYIYQNNQ